MKPEKMGAAGTAPAATGASVLALSLTPVPRANIAARPRGWMRATVGPSRSSFFWAMRLLPPERRAAICAVYAFCRTIDDIADGPGPKWGKLSRLVAWRAEVDRLYRGRPAHPATRALARPVARYGLDQADFLAVIDGMEMDVAGRMVAPSYEDLDLYCARAASAVGRLSARVFGLPPAPGEALARALGQALQLTNILRDLAEDGARGRLYLPRELLERHGIAARDPDAVLAHPALGAVCADLSALAERRFAAARAVLCRCPGGSARPVRIMCRIYGRLLLRLEERGFAPDRIACPVTLGRTEKALIVLGACVA